MAKPVLFDTPDEFGQVDVDLVAVPVLRFCWTESAQPRLPRVKRLNLLGQNLKQLGEQPSFQIRITFVATFPLF